jgi:hypothetical protein
LEILASEVSFVAEEAWAAVSFFPLSLPPKKVDKQIRQKKSGKLSFAAKESRK